MPKITSQKPGEWRRIYMREYRRGLRRGKPPLSQTPYAIQQREERAVQLAETILDPIADIAIEADFGSEEPMGEQQVPSGMNICGACDILTARLELCGFCEAEDIRRRIGVRVPSGIAA